MRALMSFAVPLRSFTTAPHDPAPHDPAQQGCRGLAAGCRDRKDPPVGVMLWRRVPSAPELHPIY